MTAFSQSGDNDILAVNKSMARYFKTIADISASVKPKRNGVNGWFRQYIAEDNRPADCGEKILLLKKNYSVNELANPQLNISNENAKKLLDVFKVFSSLNQKAFKDNVNHCHKSGVPYFDIIQRELGELAKLITTVGMIYESGGTDTEAWLAAVNSIRNVSNDVKNNRDEFGTGDNAANGFIASGVQNAAVKAKQELWKCSFAEESFEGKTKAVLLRFFTDLEDMCLIYEHRHFEWLNPAWQFEYEGIMRACVLGLSQITPNTTVSIQTDIEMRDFTPQTIKQEAITNYVVNKKRKGQLVGDFIYKIDTSVVEIPVAYKLFFNPTQIKMNYTLGRTAIVPFSNFQLKPSQNITINEPKTKEVKITVSNRTYRKLYKIHKRESVNWDKNISGL